MKFPKYVSLGFPDDIKENIVKVLEDTKPFLWDGKSKIDYRNSKVREFICHAIEETYDNNDYTYVVSLGTVIRFIQSNIDASMNTSHKTFACWYETEHEKVCSCEPNYHQYIIGLQSHRKAWIDYLINNLKGN